MNRPALGPPTPSARTAPTPLGGPGTLGSAPLTPTKCVTNAGTRQDRPTAKERCQETLFFLPFRKTLPGSGTAQSLPRTHNLPEPFSSTSHQPRSVLPPSFHCAPAEPGTAPFRAPGGLEQAAWALGPQFTCTAWCLRQGVTGDVRGEGVTWIMAHSVTVLSSRPPDPCRGLLGTEPPQAVRSEPGLAAVRCRCPSPPPARAPRPRQDLQIPNTAGLLAGARQPGRRGPHIAAASPEADTSVPWAEQGHKLSHKPGSVRFSVLTVLPAQGPGRMV